MEEYIHRPISVKDPSKVDEEVNYGGEKPVSFERSWAKKKMRQSASLMIND